MTGLKPYEQVGCRVVTHGTYWNLKNQGMVATVVKAADAGTVTVRCDMVAKTSLVTANVQSSIAGGTRIGGVLEGKREKQGH